jgi:hypothetical protein
MPKLIKNFSTCLFALLTYFATSSAGAQSWSAIFVPTTNLCLLNDAENAQYCACPQGYSYGHSQPYGENCSTAGDSTYDGCWNPTGCGGNYTGGQCCTCGDGGTIKVTNDPNGYGPTACFGGSDGQSNFNGPNPSVPIGIACIANQDCISWNNNATAGGYAQPSDQRLKRDIAPIAVTDSGIQLYSFKYLWSDQVYVGVMAQDLLKHPQWKEAVITKQNGFYAVNYSKLGLEMTTLEQYQQHHAVASVK